jgi:hypothetical protein
MHGLGMAHYWGGEKEVLASFKTDLAPLVTSFDPLNTPLHFYDFKNNKLTIL